MKRLRDLRRASGLTMKELGEKVGVAESTIHHYEMGTREPSQSVLTAIATVLGCSVDYLLEVEEKPVEMSDFTFAMHGMERDLTEHDKAVLLQMAQTLKDARRGGK